LTKKKFSSSKMEKLTRAQTKELVIPTPRVFGAK